MSSKEKCGDSSIRVGNIQNSSGIAIGNGTHVTVNQPQSSTRDEVSALLEDFMRSLELYGDSLSDAKGVRELTAAASTEVALPSPKWHAVHRLLARIAGGVAGIAALTDAINNIQALVTRIMG